MNIYAGSRRNLRGLRFSAACFALKGGMARVSLFDPRLDAGSYLTKPPAGPADPGDAYESAKFGSSTCSLMIAEAAWKFAASRRAAQLMR